MSYHLTAADSAPPIRLGKGLESSPWLRAQLPAQLGCCFADSVVLEEGLHLVYTSYTPVRDLWEDSNSERERTALTVALALEGRSCTLGPDGQRFDFIAGHGTLAAFASSVRGERRFSAHQSVRQLRLIVEEPLLHKYGLDRLAQGAHNNHATRRLACTAYTAATQRLADSVVHLHDRTGSLLDLQIAALLISQKFRERN